MVEKSYLKFEADLTSILLTCQTPYIDSLYCEMLKMTLAFSFSDSTSTLC